jgi:hypothetical protein
VTAGTRARMLEEASARRTPKPDVAADLVRLDDDGGEQVAIEFALNQRDGGHRQPREVDGKDASLIR